MINKIKNLMNGNSYIKVSIILVLLLFTISLGNACFAYFYTSGSFSGSTDITIKNFDPLVNDSSEQERSVNLANTITNNKNFGPGAEGKFKIDVNFNNVEYDAYYKVEYDRTNLPNNLKFYVDENYTSELPTFKGVIYVDGDSSHAEQYVYWKWIVDNSSSSNENDSLYMGQNINVVFNVYISQYIEENFFTVNGLEQPTGFINLISSATSNNKGRFTLSLSGIPSDTQFRVYFNRKEVTSNLHLYSDSSYQNEIDYIEGTSDINRTIYWKLDTGNVYSYDQGLYYVVVFGSW